MYKADFDPYQPIWFVRSEHFLILPKQQCAGSDTYVHMMLWVVILTSRDCKHVLIIFCPSKARFFFQLNRLVIQLLIWFNNDLFQWEDFGQCI